MESDAKELQDAKQHANGDVWSVKGSYVEKLTGPSAVVIASIQQNPIPRVDATGSVISTYKARTDDLAFTLAHDGRAWRLAQLQGVK